MGIESAVSIVIEIARMMRAFIEAYDTVVYPTFFLGYFGLGAFCCYRKGRYRTGFVAVTLSLLLVASVFSINLFPFVHMQRYTDTSDQVQSHHEVRVVDESNKEIWLDPAAVSPMDARLGSFAEDVAEDMDDNERTQHSRMVLEHANRYKNSGYGVGEPPTVPTGGLRDHWDSSTVGEFSDFETVRIYQIERGYEDESYRKSDVTETCVVEINPETETVTEGC